MKRKEGAILLGVLSAFLLLNLVSASWFSELFGKTSMSPDDGYSCDSDVLSYSPFETPYADIVSGAGDKKGGVPAGSNFKIDSGKGIFNFNQNPLNPQYSYLEIPLSAKPSQFSVSAWINLASQSFAGIVTKSSSYNDGFGLVAYSGYAHFFAGSYSGAYARTLIELNKWQHIAGTYDGKIIKIYKNGVLANSFNYSGGVSYYSSVLNLGNYLGNYFKGSMDDVAVYNRALSDSEIYGLYTDEKKACVKESPPAPTPTTPVPTNTSTPATPTQTTNTTSNATQSSGGGGGGGSTNQTTTTPSETNQTTTTTTPATPLNITLPTASCSSLIEKIKNPKDFTDEYGNLQRRAWNYSYSNKIWISGEEHNRDSYSAGWDFQEGGKEWRNYLYYSYTAHIFDADVAEAYLKEMMNWELCSSQTVTDSNGKDNFVYVCSYYYKEAENNNFRVFWINEDNKNILFELYGSTGRSYNEQQYLEEQTRRLNDFAEKLKGNGYYESISNYLPWNFYRILANDMALCGSMLEMTKKAGTDEACTSCWSCKIEPAICPPHGFQKRLCIDDCCGSEDRESDAYCNPGMCSGCMIPRWFGDSRDRKCIPYGFRFEQQTGWEKKLVESDESERLSEQSNGDVSLKVISDTEAVLIFYDRQGKNYTYNLKKGQETEVKISDWEEDIESAILVPKEIHFVSENNPENYVDFDIRLTGWSRETSSFNAYCDIDGGVKVQKTKEASGDWAKCQNSYECESNLCSGGDCIEINDMLKEASGFKSLGVKVLCGLANLMGIKDYDSCVSDFLR